MMTPPRGGSNQVVAAGDDGGPRCRRGLPSALRFREQKGTIDTSTVEQQGQSNRNVDQQERLRRLPSVERVKRALEQRGIGYRATLREPILGALAEARGALQAAKADALPQREALLEQITTAVIAWETTQQEASLGPLINATGVVIHTNLGRAPLSRALIEQALPQLCGYTNLEFDLKQGHRGRRGAQVEALLIALSGAEAALVVNNNAAALLLLLSALAADGEVIVSRGELVEIGGGFRVPEIMAQSGARLVEVGTTNRTHIDDYARAITPATRALLKVHRSNFAQQGFTAEVEVNALAALAHERGIPCWYDVGSAGFFQHQSLGNWPLIPQLVTSTDVLCLSGDKLLGSVQGGILLGRKEAIEILRRHPLQRALRLDRVRLALLAQTLEAYTKPRSAPAALPALAMLEQTAESIKASLLEPLLETLGEHLGRTLSESGSANCLHWETRMETSLVGGGALPEVRLPSCCLRLRHAKLEAQALLGALRAARPPVVGRIQEQRVILDLRTVFPHEILSLAAALASLTTQDASTEHRANQEI